MRSRVIRILVARKPSSRPASVASTRCCGFLSSPVDMYAGSRVVSPPSSVATGSPATWPAMSHSAVSSGQYRPEWKSTVSRARTCRPIRSGS